MMPHFSTLFSFRPRLPLSTITPMAVHQWQSPSTSHWACKMNGMRNATQMEYLEVCPNGDLYLDVEIRSSRILVSSQIMALCSPVFAKMLNGDFKEGMRNNEGGPEKQSIDLPEDDLLEMSILTRIFHHKTEDINISTFPQGFWSGFALLVDKYDCVATIRPTLNLWFPADQLPSDIWTLVDLLWAARTMKMHHFFSLVSWRIVLLQRTPMTDLHAVGILREHRHNIPTAMIGKTPPHSLSTALTLLSRARGQEARARNHHHRSPRETRKARHRRRRLRNPHIVHCCLPRQPPKSQTLAFQFPEQATNPVLRYGSTG